MVALLVLSPALADDCKRPPSVLCDELKVEASRATGTQAAVGIEQARVEFARDNGVTLQEVSQQVADEGQRLAVACVLAAEKQLSCREWSELYRGSLGISAPEAKVSPVMINCSRQDVALVDDAGSEVIVDPCGRPALLRNDVVFQLLVNAQQITTFGPRPGTTYIASLRRQFDDNDEIVSTTFVLGAWVGNYAVKCSDLDEIPPPTRVSLETPIAAR
jgi:hypothetical protein